MTEIMKHIGMIQNTGKRCVVVFLQIPGREDHALVVDAEALPERIHDPLMSIIRTPEGQQSQNLGEVLGRRMMPDSNRTMLEDLHIYGYLQPQPVTNIVLVPRPNSRVLLSEMLEALGRYSPAAEATKAAAKEVPPQTTPQTLPETSTLFDNNREASSLEEKTAVAKGMIAQAELLESDAKAMREKAYKLVPGLKPKEVKPAAPEKTAIKAVAKVETKVANDTKKAATPPKNSGGKTASA
jgi:hypothetical protein